MNTWRSIATVVLAILLLNGCQSTSNNPASSEESTDLDVLSEVLSRKSPSLVAENLVTPEAGGTVNLSKSKLVVPPGAVLLPVTIRWTLSRETPRGLNGALDRIYEFSPHGLQFQLPVMLFVTFDDAALGQNFPGNYAFFYYNPTTGRWEQLPTVVDLRNRRFIVQLNHFSRYSFGRKS